MTACISTLIPPGSIHTFLFVYSTDTLGTLLTVRITWIIRTDSSSDHILHGGAMSLNSRYIMEAVFNESNAQCPRPLKMILTHIRTLITTIFYLKFKSLHFCTKNLKIFLWFKHQVWIYIGISISTFVIQKQLYVIFITAYNIVYTLDIPFHPIITFLNFIFLTNWIMYTVNY